MQWGDAWRLDFFCFYYFLPCSMVFSSTAFSQLLDWFFCQVLATTCEDNKKGTTTVRVCIMCCCLCYKYHISLVKCSFPSTYHATVVAHSPTPQLLTRLDLASGCVWCDIHVFLSAVLVPQNKNILLNLKPSIGRHRGHLLLTCLTTWSVDPGVVYR